MRAVRTIPVLIDMCRDMERLCPDVVHLQLRQSDGDELLGLERGDTVRTIGLCHSVQNTAGELAEDIGVPLERNQLRGRGDQSHGLFPAL